MDNRSRARQSAETPAPQSGSRLRFELIFGSIWLAVGLFIVPAVIYWVGTAALGPYSDKARLGTFYGAYFADLASGTARTWLLALAPLLTVSLIRVLFIGVGRTTDEDHDSESDADDQQPPVRPRAAAESRRVEPRIDG